MLKNVSKEKRSVTCCSRYYYIIILIMLYYMNILTIVELYSK